MVSIFSSYISVANHTTLRRCGQLMVCVCVYSAACTVVTILLWLARLFFMELSPATLKFPSPSKPFNWNQKTAAERI